MAETKLSTHEVVNQSSDRSGFNAFAADPLLRRLVSDLSPETIDSLERHGRFCGSPEAMDLARLANVHAPSLRRFDEKGRRIDLVDYHPAYHALMRRSIADGLHASAWSGPAAEGGHRHLARAARLYMTAGVESGHLCPLTMTSASVAALAVAPDLLSAWMPRLTARQYDPGVKPASVKTGVTIGMGMTEKQGGTDLRANTTRAARSADGTYRLDGHKWFLSAPMSDAFLLLAQTGEGPSCFLVPRVLEDGRLNGLHLQRLKDKLGNRSNASAELELVEASGTLVGEPGRGIRTLIEMVSLARLDCALASSGLMFAALGEAVHHCRERKAFGRFLIDQPAMLRVLGDMALDVAAATALSMRLADSLDRTGEGGANASEASAFVRVMTPVTKYWVCKMAPALVAEAMECLGGNGYVEDGRLARAYREAPVNAIWEGPGNVMALDLLRVVERHPEAVDAMIEGIARDLGRRAGRTPDVLRAAVAVAKADEGSARLLAEQFALAAAAASLARLGHESLCDAFLETRLGGVWRHSYGMLDLRTDARSLVDELHPPLR
ncbi:acyl-CoA dehydrogenase family protein [Aurantimonas sp. Leaf443]|uniref:acyl-CoA dehydrogenase family protein n=1 Tax=Aurantimonas sp. Leaf443 TaxID=1736378 RepID=UPI0006F1F79A|nr:acyl-CoA dehydrogenase family protein [Aurantimonas sp. Leaf443]KQT83409.1 DNA alkylation response protein [Aurantimonas sp. Leaf443]